MTLYLVILLEVLFYNARNYTFGGFICGRGCSGSGSGSIAACCVAHNASSNACEVGVSIRHAASASSADSTSFNLIASSTASQADTSLTLDASNEGRICIVI
jgi:hypothetical protein